MKRKTKTFLFFVSFALAFCSLANVSFKDFKNADATAPGFRNSLDRINQGLVSVGGNDYVSAGGTSLLTYSDVNFGPQNGTFKISSGWLAAENGIKRYEYSIDGGEWQTASCTITSRADLGPAKIPYPNGHATAGISNLVISNIPAKSNFRLAFIDLSTDERVEFYAFTRYTEVVGLDYINASWLRIRLSVQDYSGHDYKQAATSKLRFAGFSAETTTEVYAGADYFDNSYITNFTDGGPADSIAICLKSKFNTADYGKTTRVSFDAGAEFPTYAYLIGTSSTFQYYEVKESISFYMFKKGADAGYKEQYISDKDMAFNPFVAIAGGWNNITTSTSTINACIFTFKNKHYPTTGMNGNVIYSDTGKGISIDGVSLSSMSNTQIDYSQNNGYLYFHYPNTSLKEGSKLLIKGGTRFYNSIFPELEFVLQSNAWVLVRNCENPDVSGSAKNISLTHIRSNANKVSYPSETSIAMQTLLESSITTDCGSAHLSFGIRIDALPTNNSSFVVTLRGRDVWLGVRFILGPTQVNICAIPNTDPTTPVDYGSFNHGLVAGRTYKFDFYALDAKNDQINAVFCVNDSPIYGKLIDKSVFLVDSTSLLGSSVAVICPIEASGSGVIYNTPVNQIAKADVQDSTLKNAFYAKQLDGADGKLVAKEDNSSHLDAEMNTVKYVSVNKGGTQVEALKVARYTPWNPTEYGDANNYSFSEVRIKASGKVKSVSFSYLLTDASTELCTLAPEGDKSYNSKSNLEIKTSSAMGGKYINASRAFETTTGILMTGDGEWHDANVVIGGTDLQHISFKVFHLQGMLLLSNINIVYETAETANTTYVSLKVTKDTSTGAITQKFIRFGLVLDDATYTALKGQGATFGMYLSYSDGTHTYYKDIALTGDYAPVKNSDNEWVSSIVLPISEAQKDIVYSAKAYMVIQGNKQYFVERSYSFTTLVAAYQQPEVYNKLSAGDKAIIDQLGGK